MGSNPTSTTEQRLARTIDVPAVGNVHRLWQALGDSPPSGTEELDSVGLITHQVRVVAVSPLEPA